MAAGVVFAAIVVLWAAYFVPLALRRYDEAARSSATASLTSRARVIRPPAVAEDPVDDGAVADEPVLDQAAADEVPTTPRLERPAARLAARRRRRTLLTLLAALTVVVALAATSTVPWWTVAVPGTLVAAWLVACRVQVRGELGLATPSVPRLPRRSAEPDEFDLAHERHLSADAIGRERDALRRASVDPDSEDTVVLSGQAWDHDPHRVHVMEQVPLDLADVEEVVVDAVPVTATTGATLWDPLPVTLPTYVDKPRAARTVRTIDFGEPGAWTSGHDADDSAEAARASAREGRDAAEQRRRAVGD